MFTSIFQSAISFDVFAGNTIEPAKELGSGAMCFPRACGLTEEVRAQRLVPSLIIPQLLRNPRLGQYPLFTPML